MRLRTILPFIINFAARITRLTMQPIIDAIERERIEAELTEERFLRNTNNADNRIYVITAADSPCTMREIGRLREEAFRSAGGGTGAALDIDGEDLAPDGYNQLIVWDPVHREIVGGYRYIICRTPHPAHLSTEHYFEFSERFRHEFLPYTIELGRAFVQPAYQGTRTNPKGIYALDNLWDGLGALIVNNPGVKYFFGKVTMYDRFRKEARNMLLYFLYRYFPDRDALMTPRERFDLEMDTAYYDTLFSGADYTENYRILSREMRNLGENVPPMRSAYMGLSPSMRVFDTVRNPDFGNTLETGLLITIDDIYPKKSERHTQGLAIKHFECI